MAYDPIKVDQIASILRQLDIDFYEKKMFAGVCFFVDDKMLCGSHTDKTSGEDLLMCRIGEENYALAMTKLGCLPMDFTGRPMKGYVFVKEEGYQKAKDLKDWLLMCLEYNPLAKKSKK